LFAGSANVYDATIWVARVLGSLIKNDQLLKIDFWGKYGESIKWFQLKLLSCYRLTIILTIVFAKSFNIGQK